MHSWVLMTNRMTGKEEPDGVTWDEVLSKERGRLWDSVLHAGGLQNIDLVNLGALLDTSPYDVYFDLAYNLFGGSAVRSQRALGDTSIDPETVDAKLETLGIRGNPGEFDTYYSRLTKYAWHDSEKAGGAHFMPIYDRLARLSDEHPDDAERLGVLRRRLVHLEMMREELAYLEERFVYERIPTLEAWAMNKLEVLVSIVAEVAVGLTEYYGHRVDGEIWDLRFSELIDRLEAAGGLFESINMTLDGYLVTQLRNSVVHGTGARGRVEDGQLVLEASFDQRILGFGCMLEYLKKAILAEKPARVIDRRECDDVFRIFYEDPRFQGVRFSFPVTKKGTADLSGARAHYSMEMLELVEKEMGFLFLLARELLDECLAA